MEREGPGLVNRPRGKTPGAEVTWKRSESEECPKIQALMSQLKEKYGSTFLSGMLVFTPPLLGPYHEAEIRMELDFHLHQHQELALQGERKEAMEKVLPESINRGSSEPSHSEWASPCLIVPRKAAGKGGLWSTTAPHVSYTWPLIEDMLQKQFRWRNLTVIDLKHTYQQVPLADESQACTAMSTPLGLLQLKVMPMGVTNNKAVFQRMLESLLEAVRYSARPFVKDVIIASGDPSMNYEQMVGAHQRNVTGLAGSPGSIKADGRQ